jgi:5-methylthioadenosine/S-adenosylhomocysteine deaminase
MVTKAVIRQVIRNGLLLDPEQRSVEPTDLLIDGDSILEAGPPGLDAPDDATVIDATDRLLMPGLVNAHTHGHTSLGKGSGDKWSLELLLNAAPWLNANQTHETRYLAARLNAVELILKGCTSAYDMFFEAPSPSMDGIATAARPYAEVGVRVVMAPMMADTSLYQTIPGLLDSLPEPHRSNAEKAQFAPWQNHIDGCRALLQDWTVDRGLVRPALGPTIPHHYSDDFVRACRDLAQEYDVGIQMHLAESKVQAVAGLKLYGKTLTSHLDELGLLGPKFSGAHCIWLDEDDVKRFSDCGASVAHNPGSIYVWGMVSHRHVRC